MFAFKQLTQAKDLKEGRYKSASQIQALRFTIVHVIKCFYVCNPLSKTDLQKTANEMQFVNRQIK